MIFASFEFLCLFLPIFLASYFLTPARLRNWQVLVLSWAFYAWWRVDFLALLAVVTVFTFLMARLIERGRSRLRLVVGLAGNLGVLAYFKYANFGVAAFNDGAAALGLPGVGWSEIVLPIGLSFYVLQSVSYLVDVWRGTVSASRNFVNYAAYKALFVQLIAGPIVRYAEIAGDLGHRTTSLVQFGLGARRFMIGFAMKVCLADALSPLVDGVFALERPTLVEAWLGAVSYTLQLYFDFAGYSAMAIGLALALGFHFPENFDNPYLAGSIQNFWQRWHITLSRFLRDYLYIPLGGNRGSPARVSLNLWLTMLIGGFWHGAAWNFLLWGAWHGGLLAANRGWRARGGRLPFWAGHGLTMLTVVIGWVVFRAVDLHGAGQMLAGMLGLHGVAMSDAAAWQVTPDLWWGLAAGVAVIYWPLLRLRWVGGEVVWAGAPVLAFCFGVVLLYSRAAVPFLYFQF